MRFYYIGLPLEIGIAVCDGVVTAKQARVTRDTARFCGYRTHICGEHFTTDLEKAKKVVTNKLLDDIHYHELRIQRLKSALNKVHALDADAELWTDTRGDDPE